MTEGKLRWARGNVHTHTLNSDGDSPPSDVARWYRDSGYQFLAITDHNVRTDIDGLQWELDREAAGLGTPLVRLIPGEEVTDAYADDAGHYDLHVNALGCPATLGPQGGDSKIDVLQRTIDAIAEAGGIAIVNHPNFRWSIDIADLMALRSDFLLEIRNAHPKANSLGNRQVPGCEEMWDELLTAGRKVLAVVSDDAHVLGRFHSRLPNPGKMWLECLVADDEEESILQALRTGAFYCSNGVELAEVTPHDSTLHVAVRQHFDCAYTITWIGSGGRVLDEVEALEARYSLGADEPYVRARVTSSHGEHAWTQPLFRASNG